MSPSAQDIQTSGQQRFIPYMGIQQVFAVLPIHLTVSTLSLVLWTRPSGSGKQALVSVWQVHSRGTQIQSPLFPIHLIVLSLSLALWTRPSGFGIQALVSVWQVHSRGTQN